MRKFLVYILILFTLIGFFTPVNFVSAQACGPGYVPVNNTCVPEKDYSLLVPLPCSDPTDPNCIGGEISSFDTSDTDNLGKYQNLMIKLIIGLSAVMAVVMIVIGGIEYMTSELPGNKEHGKERIRNAILGLLIALGAWALLYTINPDLLSTKIDIPLATVTVGVDIPQGCTGGKCAGYPEGADWAAIAGDPMAPIPGVSVRPPGDCQKVGQQNCTSIRGLQPGYVRAIAGPKPNGCGCAIIITGGTESWLHSPGTAHGPRSAVVDLAAGNTILDNYIKSGTPTSENRWTKNGISFLLESDHWHVGG